MIRCTLCGSAAEQFRTCFTCAGTAEQRRHAGIVNGFAAFPGSRRIAPHEPQIPFGQWWPEMIDGDFTDSQNRDPREPEPLRGTDYEWRNERWYRMSNDKRAYTWAEKNTAMDLLSTGASASVVGEKLSIPAATIRTWGRRRRLGDWWAASQPRFKAP